MRFLMACMRFPTAPGDSYLTNELAQALTAEGHEVEVLLIDWDAAPQAADGQTIDWNGIRVVRCTPRLLNGCGRVVRNASKFLLTGRHAGRLLRTQFYLGQFDAFIAWSPALAFAPFIGSVRRAGIARRLLFIWDFFPDHHREIGLIPGGPIYWIVRAWEQRLMSAFTALICTLPQNAAYLRRNFRVHPDQSVRVTPIWTDAAPVPPADRAAIRRLYDLPQDQPIAVFGGQLVEGRGFDQMLAAAAAGMEQESPLLFLFVGEGRLAPMLRAQTQPNVLWRAPIKRDAYVTLLSACDAGMVATVPGVTSFTIPSKTLDYLRAGLPVVAAVEPGNDFADLLVRHGVGRAVPFGDAQGFLHAAEALAAGPSVRDAALACLEEVFHVRRAVAAVTA